MHQVGCVRARPGSAKDPKFTAVPQRESLESGTPVRAVGVVRRCGGAAALLAVAQLSEPNSGPLTQEFAIARGRELLRLGKSQVLVRCRHL